MNRKIKINQLTNIKRNLETRSKIRNKVFKMINTQNKRITNNIIKIKGNIKNNNKFSMNNRNKKIYNKIKLTFNKINNNI